MNQPRQRIGIKHVATRAGVSLSSVSRVLDGHPDVSDVMRQRVMDAVQALGYIPDPVAQSMRTGTTKTIGFVAGDTSNPLIAQIGAAAQLQLLKSGYSLLIANSSNEIAQERSNIQLLRNRKVDGLLLSVADESADGLLEQLSESTTPVVLVDRELRDDSISAVHSDHALGTTQAAEHLLGLGHRHVALINGNPRVRPSRERAAALRAAFSAHPDAEVNVANGTFSEIHGYDAAMALLQRPRRATALIAGSNQILVGVLRAIRDLGLGIPDDVSLVTCDGTPLAELYQPTISTITRDPAEIGTVAAELLRVLIGGEPAQIRHLPTTYSAAASCGPPRESEH